MPVKTSLSVTVAIGGVVIPLTAASLDLAKDKAKESIDKGVAFSLPANSPVSCNLGSLVEWLQKTAGDTSFALPSAITDRLSKGKTLDEIDITISAFSVDTKGHLLISVTVHFEQGLDDLVPGLAQMKTFIDIQDIGLTFAYDKAPAAPSTTTPPTT